MAEEGREPKWGDIDEARRRVLWQALLGGPVIVTLSSSPAWASQYGYDDKCKTPKKIGKHDCRKDDD